jgi:hypothetical protein
MTSSGPHSDTPARLSDPVRSYYLILRTNHRNNPKTGTCAVCNRDTCHEYLFARGILLSGGVSV